MGPYRRGEGGPAPYSTARTGRELENFLEYPHPFVWTKTSARRECGINRHEATVLVVAINEWL
nr:hypothetical protein OG781_06630 [Streptomyces sp. NBC_00830]